MLIDSKGKLLNYIPLSDTRALNHASMTRLPNVFIDGKICLFIFPDIAKDDPSFFEGHIFFELIVDISTGENRFLPFSWPEVYKGRHWTFYHTFPSRILGKNNKLVYSFGADHRLYTVSLDGIVESRDAKSDHIKDILWLKSGADEHETFMSSGIYAMIIYDKYRDVYYRIAGLETDPLLPDGKFKSVNLKPYSILLLDSSFAKIGETILFPKESYLIKDWFVCSKGLCISTANPEKRNINEDEMQFNVLVIDTIKSATVPKKSIQP